MEEDIEILEYFKKNGYAMLLIRYGDRNETNLKLERAIENLIKGYKELKGKVRFLEEWKEFYNEDSSQIRKKLRQILNLEENIEDLKALNMIEKMLKDSVPKSELREKLEQLKKQYKKIVNKPNDKEIIDKLVDFKEITARIQILEEILGG